VLRTDPQDPPSRRLAQLRAGVSRVLADSRPDAVAVERVFFSRNVRTAMTVGQASGVTLATAAEFELQVASYTPTEVKQSVVGFGGATKRQVGAMVASLLGLKGPPRPPDTADAAALAICHLNRAGFVRSVKEALG
jgi:crossover junction endodeoxyribonuclease RuvC